MTAPDITVRIDRLVIETSHPVDATAFRRALNDALHTVLSARGIPPSWDGNRTRASTVVDDWTWDGRGGTRGLATAVATRLYEEALR